MLKIFTLLYLIIYSVTCLAQAIQFPYSDEGWDRQLDGLLPEKWHSLGFIKLYETTFDDIEQIYGETNKFKKGEKNYSPYLQCYLVGDDYVVVFQSGPLGGWSTVTGILIAKKTTYNNKNCSKRIEAFAGINGLQIGDKEDKLFNLLGKPTFKGKNFVAYRYEQKSGSKVLKARMVYVTSGIEVGVHEGRVSWVRVYWQEST